MSRRDIAVNTLLGTFLLLVFFVCLTAIGLIFLFGFIGLDWVARRVFPGWIVPAGASVFAAWVLLSLWYVIRDLREKYWRNALLFFATAPLMGFAWFTPIQSSIGGNGHALFFWVPVMTVIAIADDATLGRLKFFLGAAVAGAAMSVNCGLLGNGVLSHAVANCVLAVTITWWIVTIRNKHKTDNPDLPLSLPPAGA